MLGTGIGPYNGAPMIDIYDLWGYVDRAPRFAKRYSNLKVEPVKAAKQFVQEVHDGVHPGPEHYYHMANGEYEGLLELVGQRDSGALGLPPP